MKQRPDPKKEMEMRSLWKVVVVLLSLAAYVKQNDCAS